MVQILSKADFLLVPWKNGLGVTSELTRISACGNGEFDFRLSIAQVNQNGPFSLYPGFDRFLVLLEGDGLKCKGPKDLVVLNRIFDYFTFKGEDLINCELLGSTCVDFNVMTNREYGRSEVIIEKCASLNWKALNFTLFIYLVNTQELIILAENETFIREDLTSTSAILVRLYLIK